MSVASAINTLGEFCGVRDIPALTRAELLRAYGYDRADVLVLFGASILAAPDGPVFKEPAWGMWDMDHYARLLLGEIARLRDDGEDYGPRGKGFIAHVDIPPEVEEASGELKQYYEVREANPEFAS